LKKSNSKLFSLDLIILTLNLIISPANFQANVNDDLIQRAYTGKLKNSFFNYKVSRYQPDRQ